MKTTDICTFVTAALILGSCEWNGAARGKTYSEEEVKGTVRTSLDSPNPTQDQLARRRKSLEALANLGLIRNESLPVVEEESSFSSRTAEEISGRCLAVLVCAVKGETGDQRLVDQLISDFHLASEFSPAELAFVRDPNPPRQDRVNFAWQYEAVHVLLWSLGLQEKLEPPNKVVDVPSMAEIVREHEVAGLAASSRPRSKAELLDQADLYYHLHWSAIELRLRGQSSEAVNEEIIMERHKALNWLIRYMNQEWDEVTTDT